MIPFDELQLNAVEFMINGVKPNWSFVMFILSMLMHNGGILEYVQSVPRTSYTNALEFILQDFSKNLKLCLDILFKFYSQLDRNIVKLNLTRAEEAIFRAFINKMQDDILYMKKWLSLNSMYRPHAILESLQAAVTASVNEETTVKYQLSKTESFNNNVILNQQLPPLKLFMANILGNHFKFSKLSKKEWPHHILLGFPKPVMLNPQWTRPYQVRTPVKRNRYQFNQNNHNNNNNNNRGSFDRKGEIQRKINHINEKLKSNNIDKVFRAGKPGDNDCHCIFWNSGECKKGNNCAWKNGHKCFHCGDSDHGLNTCPNLG